MRNNTSRRLMATAAALLLLLSTTTHNVLAWTMHSSTMTRRQHQRWQPSHKPARTTTTTRRVAAALFSAAADTVASNHTNKQAFLSSLDALDRLNAHTPDRTKLLQNLIAKKVEIPLKDYVMAQTSGIGDDDDKCIAHPGLVESMQAAVVSGTNTTSTNSTWKVIYAPHMTTMASLLMADGNHGDGLFDVSYILDGSNANSASMTMTSHAILQFPWLPNSKQQVDGDKDGGGGAIALSVSGTYGSVSSNVCRVDFDKAWVTTRSFDYYTSFDDVPNTFGKSIISTLGQLLFIPHVSIFPISYLDDELVVFDFELLGTRICARKID